MPLRTLGARTPLRLHPWTPSRPLPVTLAAEDAPGSTAEAAVQISTFLVNEADKLRRDTTAESDKVRRETTAAIQALSQNVALLAEKMSQQAEKMSQQNGQLAEKMSQQNGQLAEKMSQQAERMSQQIAQLDSRLAGLESTVKVVGAIAGGLGLGAVVLMYFRSAFTQ